MGKNPLFMSTEIKKIVIVSDYITLGQFLKFTHVISSGSQEKLYLSTHQAHVNDVLESRRGRKLYPGDKVVLAEGSFEIVR